MGGLIDDTQQDDGIGNSSYEKDPAAVGLLKTLNRCYEIFKEDPSLDEDNGMKEFTIEYFIISIVMLIRHIYKYYAIPAELHSIIRQFVYEFHSRWKEHNQEDRDILIFSDNRQQSEGDLEARERILRLAFFDFIEERGITLKALDSKRAFSEAERIRIYRKHDGICQQCLAGGLAPERAKVSWSQFQADHIFPWIKGGKTQTWNGQVLCKAHNASKGGE